MELREVYEAEFGYVWNCLRRFGVPSPALEDVAHDVFLVVHRRLGTYDRARPIRPWLAGICFRVAADHRKRAHVRYERDGLAPELPSPGPTPEEAASDRERSALVLEALEALDEAQRVVFVMHDIDGFSIPEIAAELDVKPNTLYSRLRLGRQRFTTTVRRLRAAGGRP
ncbi:MAG: sigma-70 family RNA polymerase sigma factor [Deltaproteobacteria bacterium]